MHGKWCLKLDPEREGVVGLMQGQLTGPQGRQHGWNLAGQTRPAVTPLAPFPTRSPTTLSLPIWFVSLCVSDTLPLALSLCMCVLYVCLSMCLTLNFSVPVVYFSLSVFQSLSLSACPAFPWSHLCFPCPWLKIAKPCGDQRWPLPFPVSSFQILDKVTLVGSVWSVQWLPLVGVTSVARRGRGGEGHRERPVLRNKGAEEQSPSYRWDRV